MVRSKEVHHRPYPAQKLTAVSFVKGRRVYNGVSSEALFYTLFLYPCDGKINKLSLTHQLNSGIADLNRADGVFFFESLADFFKIFAIDRQGFVSLPDSFSVFKEDAVFYAGMLLGYSARTSARCRDVFLSYPVPSCKTFPSSS